MKNTWTLATDSHHDITVESKLVYAIWLQGRAFGGFKAQFEVKTILVGDGAKVKVVCRTEKGRKLDKIDGVIVRNRFRGEVLIPENVKPEDYVYLEVELPKYGLSIDSNDIPVRLPLMVSSMAWSKKEAGRDEEVNLNCTFTNGVEDGDAVTVIIYEYDNDGYHDKVVTIPAVIKKGKVDLRWKFIYQEDTDDIPTQKEMEKYGKSYNPPEYFFVVMVDNIAVGDRQESGLLVFKDQVELECLDNENKPVPGAAYTIKFADGTTRDGKLDENGTAAEKKICPGKVEVEYRLSE